ncbi:MAG: DUF4252 domain-containing protein [Nonlabens sp.]
MNKLILKIVGLGILAVSLLTSCEDDSTLQTYLVDSQEKTGFISTTVPKSVLGIDDSSFTPDSREAFRSIEKVNLLMLPATADKEAMINEEKEKLEAILSRGNYKTLMSHNSDGIKARFLYEGDTDSIDEFIIYGSAKQGMGLARVMGNDMNLGKIMKMMRELEKSDISTSGLQGVFKNLGVNTDDLGNGSDGFELNIEETDSI